MIRALSAACLVLALSAPAPGAADDRRTLQFLEDRHTHALLHVPPGDDTGARGRADCAGVKALDRRGRNLVRVVGRTLERSGIHFDLILTSRACTALHTATGLKLGPVTEEPALDPGQDETALIDSADTVLSILDGLRRTETALIIADAAVIEALSGETPAPGEIVVFTLPPGGEPALRGLFGVPGS